MVEKMKQQKLPTRSTCLSWIKERNPKNIVDHSKKVNKIAVYLAKKLQAKGVDINIDVVDRASLLHDLDKFETLTNGLHGKETGKFLRAKGYIPLAQIIEKHITHRILDKGFAHWSWETKLVYYADKRVNHSTLVDLPTRFDYFMKTYVKTQAWKKKMLHSKKKLMQFEKTLFNLLGISSKLHALK
jgi:putative nucleotidyltransferase with HDIG domain